MCIPTRPPSGSTVFHTKFGETRTVKVSSPFRAQWRHRKVWGFTLVELLVVLAILATLLSIALPRYFDSISKANEAVLRANLRILRESIDKHRADTGQWPASLQSLVDRRYIRSIPTDPVADGADLWILLAPPDGASRGVFDVRSGASGVARDGSSFTTW